MSLNFVVEAVDYGCDLGSCDGVLRREKLSGLTVDETFGNCLGHSVMRPVGDRLAVGILGIVNSC